MSAVHLIKNVYRLYYLRAHRPILKCAAFWLFMAYSCDPRFEKFAFHRPKSILVVLYADDTTVYASISKTLND